ncbi:MAG: hypothetical protein AB1553_15380 [Nitrospirota bacterium]
MTAGKEEQPIYPRPYELQVDGMNIVDFGGKAVRCVKPFQIRNRCSRHKAIIRRASGTSLFLPYGSAHDLGRPAGGSC